MGEERKEEGEEADREGKEKIEGEYNWEEE